MDWGYLKELQLHGSVSITGLKSLVSKLPMLEKMRIYNLRLRMNSTIFDEILAKKPDIAPISTSIRRAGFVINPVIANCATDLKVYLERLLPNAMVTIKVSKGSVMLDKLDI
ncbi:hypothetical protein H4S06_000986 [Coemansia sp. BCRC 34490]|nr:hypothetical protein H4S06_000986 [Coemansia sp. BCRC 34490]